MSTILFILSFAIAVVVIAALMIVLIYHLRPKKPGDDTTNPFRRSRTNTDLSA